MSRRVAGWISLLGLIGAVLALPEFFPGNLPLYEAIEEGDLGAVDRLLAGGANPNSQSPGLAWLGLGKHERLSSALASPPLVYALERRQPDIALKLVAAGADPKARDGGGRPVLFAAAASGRLDLVRALAAKGADLRARDPQGGTVLFAPPISPKSTRPEPRHLEPELRAWLEANGAR